jgi:hypothetical protein
VPGSQWAAGPDSGTGDPEGRNDGLILHVCAGTGGYIGLTFMAQQAVSFRGTADFGDGTSLRGVLYEGPPPPPLASLSPASE